MGSRSAYLPERRRTPARRPQPSPVIEQPGDGARPEKEMVNRMPDQPAPVPVTPRGDESAAGLGTLEDMGIVEPQSAPSPEPPQPPVYPLSAPGELPTEGQMPRSPSGGQGASSRVATGGDLMKLLALLGRGRDIGLKQRAVT